jgi:DNA-binding ferritin-like protein
MELTPELIQAKLFSMRAQAHKFHLDTRSYAEHKVLGKVYDKLGDFTDEISEKLMGYQGGKRIGVSNLDELKVYSQDAVNKMVKDGIDFSYSLYEWSGKKKYSDLENIAQSLSGLFAETAYQLTLS